MATSDRRRRQSEVGEAALIRLAGARLLWQREDLIAYECDGLTAYASSRSSSHCRRAGAGGSGALALCHRLDVPVVARGAGTGLSGGALPNPLGVTLSLAKFNRIVGVDAKARTATVQCGVRNLAISDAAAPYESTAPDPHSKPRSPARSGGNVAENSRAAMRTWKYPA